MIILGILEGIGGFLVFVAMGFAVTYLISLVAKLTNTRVVTRSGSIVANPDTFDGVNSLVKSQVTNILAKIKNLDIKKYQIIIKRSSSKLDKIKVLHELYLAGALSEMEYEILKKEII